MRGHISHLALISYLILENPTGCPYYLIKIISDETSFTKNFPYISEEFHILKELTDKC